MLVIGLGQTFSPNLNDDQVIRVRHTATLWANGGFIMFFINLFLQPLSELTGDSTNIGSWEYPSKRLCSKLTFLRIRLIYHGAFAHGLFDVQNIKRYTRGGVEEPSVSQDPS